ncbi:hypothetical protein [Sphingobium sp. CR28]|uniref:hypothetical protein n=1 Tax=Sphingobium sp. CR28 TaxID=3400272 RepID=UPI003FEEE1E8
MIRRFHRFACFDWSGAAVSHPPGIALAVAEAEGPPRLIPPPEGRFWSRASALDWLGEVAARNEDMLIGMDLSPAMPFVDHGAYFPGWADTPADARALWQLVETLCTEDPHLSAGGVLAHPELRRHFRQHRDLGDLYPAGAGRMRVCELGQRQMGLSPYSCLNLVGAAQVGKSSLTAMRLFHRLGGAIPIWPFDPVPASGPLIVEIYTSLAALEAGRTKSRSKMRDGAALDTALAAFGSPPHAPIPRYTDHATDALLTAAWLRHVHGEPARWSPAGLSDEIACTEGWTFGVF